MSESVTEPAENWRSLVGIGVVAGDLHPDTIARCAGVSRLEALEALYWARTFGLLDDQDQLHPDEATRLMAELGIDKVSAVHAELATHYLTSGRDHLEAALVHARQVSSAADTEAMIALCDHSGEMNLSLGDYSSALALLKVADELDINGDDSRRGRRLLQLAAATDGTGDVISARKILERAHSIGERIGDLELMVESAVQHTLPTDWYAGDHRSLVMLQRTEQRALSPEQTVRITAARSMAEARIPVLPHEGQQVAWITRPEVSRPMAEKALAASVGMSPEVRAIALLAWRSSHRSPSYLAQRREVSAELVRLVHELQWPDLQVDASVFMGVDALEAADRRGFDSALGISRWVADRDGNPRLLWRTATLAAGAAHLDGKPAEADALAAQGEQLGQAINTPGWFAAKMFFLAQSAISSDDPEQMRPLLLDEAHVGMTNPLALSGIAYCYARNGDASTSLRFARTALRHLDFESSPLLLLTRVAAVALSLEDTPLRREAIELLTPWTDHVSIDGNGWWCDGPVSLWLALLHASLGEPEIARPLAEVAQPVVMRLHDVRSQRRLQALRARLDRAHRERSPLGLTPREIHVLHLLCQGLTNPAIAHALNFSVSTVRNDTTAIYRKLEVTGRAEAVAKAHSMGIVGPETVTQR